MNFVSYARNVAAGWLCVSPAFIGQQTMRNKQGKSVVNPLYTIYGCSNPL